MSVRLIILLLISNILLYTPVKADAQIKLDSATIDVFSRALGDELTSTSTTLSFMEAVNAVCAKKIGSLTESLLGERIDKLPNKEDTEKLLLYKSSMKACITIAKSRIETQLQVLEDLGW